MISNQQKQETLDEIMVEIDGTHNDHEKEKQLETENESKTEETEI